MNARAHVQQLPVTQRRALLADVDLLVEAGYVIENALRGGNPFGMTLDDVQRDLENARAAARRLSEKLRQEADRP